MAVCITRTAISLIGGAISWTVTWYKSEGKVKIDELTEMVWEMALK
ncbi:hypothetical protein J683_3813 [Acinetobacter baumannii 1007214]|nr:hypothetical protein ACIN5098_3229 [Acinetobacter baumannii OIFC098]EXB88595.1 hypothetical protein J510_3695 [Acinetobacter baumannii 466760]EXE19096.1 hypothetical protein J561_3269 [Acinetobacter baumannii 50595]EXH86835.1 hypothetical protein J609_3825 [Acinetobacter baumannii 3390]EXQ76386.1 hypothetical protein J683_3813 [Acinetobacter baumannii 1007214]KCY32645.1 hypothetical protein J726_4000 [Acinetobacter baumannii 1262761-105]